GVRHTARCNQQVRAADGTDRRARALPVLESQVTGIARDESRVGGQIDLDAVCSKNLLDLAGDIRILARQELRRALQDRDGASEAPKDLREFEPDVSAAEYDEMRRDLGELHDRRRRETWHVIQSFDAR